MSLTVHHGVIEVLPCFCNQYEFSQKFFFPFAMQKKKIYFFHLRCFHSLSDSFGRMLLTNVAVSYKSWVILNLFFNSTCGFFVLILSIYSLYFTSFSFCFVLPVHVCMVMDRQCSSQ